MKMQEKVQNFIEKNGLLNREQCIIVGVSGGADSVVLLYILMSLGYNCVIAHCNFHLRMEESDRDEQFVRKLVKTLNLPSYFTDFNTVNHSKQNRISIEMAARELRYEWFNDLLKESDGQAIAVAHHADDSIETMLMNLVRGTGLRGLTGISARNGSIVRPLLCCTRSEIENYIQKQDLEHITDSTNALSDYQRNKFRNEILPLLEEINPSVRETLYASSKRFAGTLAIYEQAIGEITNNIVEKSMETVKIDIVKLKKQADVQAVLYEIMREYGFHSDQINQVAVSLEGESGKMFFSETHRLLKDREKLIISKKEQESSTIYTIFENTTEIEEPFLLKIKKIVYDSDFIISKDKNKIHIDASKLKFPIQLRRWQEGDIFYPFGMSNQKKISDFFIDNKFSLLEKEQTWLLTSGVDVVWIVGKRLDNRFRVNSKTVEILELSI